MKKILILFMSVVFSTTFISCNNDDNGGSSTREKLIGKWQFHQNGTEVNGTEILVPFEPKCDSKTDFVEIFDNNTLKVTLYNEDCKENDLNNEWQLNGNTVSIDSGEITQIVVLNNTTLKTRGVNKDGIVIILEFKRI